MWKGQVRSGMLRLVMTLSQSVPGGFSRGLLVASLFAAAAVLDASGLLPAQPELQLAYLDPGSGSFMIQALIAALAGVAVTLRAYWSRIRSFFGAEAPEEAGEETAVKPVDE